MTAARKHVRVVFTGGTISMARAKPSIFPTVAPAPAPTLPSAIGPWTAALAAA